MKTKYITAALAVATTLSAFSVKANDTAYMGVNGGDFGTIDLGTGVFTILGNSGQTLAGMAVASATLYGASYHTASGSLFTINPADGSLSTVGTSTVNYDDFGSTTFGLFAVGIDASLYSVNSATGAATLLGPTGLAFGSWRSLSTNASALYFANGANLYTLDTATGAPTLIGNMGGPQIGAMLMENGILYGGQETPGLRVDTLDPTTGLATAGPGLIGSTNPFYALAPNPLPTPEPTTAVLLLSGAVLCLRRCSLRTHERNAS